MDSKIFIDLDSQGNPQLRIDYKHTGDGSDVRDKMIGRFLSEVLGTEGHTTELVLEHSHSDRDGTVALVRLKSHIIMPLDKV